MDPIIKVSPIKNILGINFSRTWALISFPKELITADIELFIDITGIIEVIPNKNIYNLSLIKF